MGNTARGPGWRPAQEHGCAEYPESLSLGCVAESEEKRG